MGKNTIKTVKAKSLTSQLRELTIGESVKVSSSRESVRNIVSRLRKEGLEYSATAAGLKTGIVVTRLN